MYAVILTGGKQYKVSAGDVIDVEKLNADAGAKVEFDVLMTVDGDKTEVGTPLLARKVKAEVAGIIKGDKITIFKYKAKKNVRKKKGHRQRYTRVKILEI